MVKLQNTQEKEIVVKEANEIIYKETEIRLSIYFSTITMAALKGMEIIPSKCSERITVNFNSALIF